MQDMATYFTFSELVPGQWVKIAGKTMPGCGFQAVEIVLEPSDGSPKLEGELQAIDPIKRRLHFFDRELPLTDGIAIEWEGDRPATLEELLPGVVVKVKGTYQEGGRFVPKKIKVKPGLEFNIEELQGAIEAVDRQHGQFEVNGVRIFVNEKTIFQAVEQM